MDEIIKQAVFQLLEIPEDVVFKVQKHIVTVNGGSDVSTMENPSLEVRQDGFLYVRNYAHMENRLKSLYEYNLGDYDSQVNHQNKEMALENIISLFGSAIEKADKVIFVEDD